MFPPKRILFAVDFSKQARAMARTVREVAQLCGAEVQVLHAIELTPHDFPADRLEEAQQKLDALIAGELAECETVVHVTPGDPANTVVHVARNGNSDLIMMPTHGHGVFLRSALGSVTAKVLHDAPCPVWTSAHQEQTAAYDGHGIRTILCALDLGARSSSVLREAGQAARLWSASLRVVHVMEIAEPSTKSDWTPERRDQMTSTVEAQLRRLAEEAGENPIIEVLEGSPAKTVIETAERYQADLIVVGRTQAPTADSQPSSTAYGIIAGSRHPVLSV